MLAALLILTHAPADAQVRLVQQEGQTILHVARASYQLQEPVTMSLDGGDLLPSGPNAPATPPLSVGWYRDGQQLGWIDMAKLVGDWLDDDNVWGGHKAANEMRYMASGGGGVYAEMVEAYPQADHTSLGVLAIREGGPSGQPIAAEFLVRFYPAPLCLERIRPILTPGDRFRWTLYPKLFPYQDHLLLVTSDQVQELKSDGSVKRKWIDLPKGTVVHGLAEHRWLIGERSSVQGYDTVFEATDLSTRSTTTLLTYQGTNPPLIAAPDLISPPRSDSSYLLFDQGRYDNQRGARFTIHLPDGQRATMPPDSMYLAGPYVVGQDTQKPSVVSAKTGLPIK